MLLLVGFFGLLPAAFRAARLSLDQKKNDVKDWLPSDFRETGELAWFAEYFAGESFVVATWDGCTEGDDRLRLFETKLRRESASHDPTTGQPEFRHDRIRRARELGREMSLTLSGETHHDWGGENEKWIADVDGHWYYLLPDGRLYRWDEAQTGPAGAVRAVRRWLGRYELSGQLITALDDVPAGERSVFWNEPSLLTTPLFETVQTGPGLVSELASPGGPLWPIDGVDPARREVVARRRAMQRLTGSLFAPAAPRDLVWTGRGIVDAALQRLAPEVVGTIDRAAAVAAAERHLAAVRADDPSDVPLGDRSTAERDALWYETLDRAGVPAPPRLTAVLVTLSDVGKRRLSAALGRGVGGMPRGRLLRLAEASGLTAAPPPSLAPPPFDRPPPIRVGNAPALRLGGPPVDNVAIDEEGTVTLVRLVGYSLLLGVVLAQACFRSFKITIMVFIVGGSSALLSMAVVRWTGGRVDAVLMSMPSLVYVLGLSGAIHIVNYYRDEVRLRGSAGAPGRAARHAAVPCSLAALTTAIGLVSLGLSNLAPISNFGMYAAAGVVATVGVLFLYLPAALAIYRPLPDGPSPVDRDEDAEPGHAPETIDAAPPRLAEAWATVGRWIAGHHGLAASLCVAALLAAAAGLPKLRTSVQLLKLFDEDARIIDDYAWLEKNFGKLVPMEVVVRIPPSVQEEVVPEDAAALDLLERVEAVAMVRGVVESTLGENGLGVVGQVTAADTFLPPLPPPSNQFNTRRATLTRELENEAERLRDNDYLQLERRGPYAGSELYRVSLRVAALSDVDYGRFIQTLRGVVTPITEAFADRERWIRHFDAEGIESPRVLIVGDGASPQEVGLNHPERSSGRLGATIAAESDDAAAGQIDGRRIAATAMATLAQNVSGWRLTRRTIDRERAKRIVEKPAWRRFLSKFDLVIWDGGGGLTAGDLAAARHLAGASRAGDARIEPRPILADGVPDVVDGGPLTAVFTGVVPVIYKAQRTLLVSLTESIGMAFVLIAAVMFLLLNPGRGASRLRPRNVGNAAAAAAVSMIPNVFPVVAVFGVLCHLGIRIDIGTMMVASVAMGVAVDDTIHFLTWFRDHLDAGMDRTAAVIETYRKVGPAMTQTTIVGGLGLFVFALSTFTPTQRFGVLMLVMLATALIGDLVLLPALLAGPLGRFFRPRQPAATPAADEIVSDTDGAYEADDGVPSLRLVRSSDDDAPENPVRRAR